MDTILSNLLLISRAVSSTTSIGRSSLSVAKKELPFLPTKSSLNRFRTGSFIGKLGRHVFGHNLLHRVLGTQIALAAVATNLISGNPASALNQAIAVEPIALKAENVSFITELGVQSPLSNLKINQGYRFYHPGLDLEGSTGEPVKPVMDGRVSEAGYSRLGYGNTVVVDHGNGITSLYAHLSKIEVKVGEKVSMDTEIGKVGSTGRSTGSHLHLEVREEGRAVNPLTILPRL